MRDILIEGLTELGLPTDAVPDLERYAAMMMEKNRVMDLTAITNPDSVACLHLLDSAAVAAACPLSGKTVIDVGTGAGLPGMVLALLHRDAQFTLLDSLGKRVAFLQWVCDSMGLDHVRCVHARAEEFAATHREVYDIATSRAVATLNMLCELTLPLVKVGGKFIAMKSIGIDKEIAVAQGAIAQLGGHIVDMQDYYVPTTGIPHRLIIIEKQKPTPMQFPRAFARIKKAPLR